MIQRQPRWVILPDMLVAAKTRPGEPGSKRGIMGSRSSVRGGALAVLAADSSGAIDRNRPPFREHVGEKQRAVCFALLLGTVCGCSAGHAAPDESAGVRAGRAPITQVSVVNALMLGEYEGGESIAELLRLGDFGVGTLDHLDGELIVLDGRAYQVRGDGQVLDVDPTRTTPFATVTHFAPDGEMPCPRVKRLAELDEALDDALGRKNAFLAVKIHGRFESIVLRSVARQEPPYRPLAEVAKSQSVWTHANVSGTLVGIRSPAWAVGMNVPGYHWHFLSDDHNLGGHVLDCRVDEARVAYEVGRDWLVKLQDSAAFNALNLRADQSRELKRVESARGE